MVAMLRMQNATFCLSVSRNFPLLEGEYLEQSMMGVAG